jgi:hypothetical protein
VRHIPLDARDGDGPEHRHGLAASARLARHNLVRRGELAAHVGHALGEDAQAC